MIDTLEHDVIHFGGRDQTQLVPLPPAVSPNAEPTSQSNVADIDGDDVADVVIVYDASTGFTWLAGLRNTGITPPTDVPEVPVTIALPASAALMGGLFMARRVRRPKLTTR